MGPIFRAALWPNQIWTLYFLSQIPLGFCGFSTTASQSQAFWQLMKIDKFCLAAELKFFDIFFQAAAILRQNGIMTWNKARWSSENQIFIIWKKLNDILKPHLRYLSLKTAPSCRRKSQDGFPCRSRFPRIDKRSDKAISWFGME